MGSQASARGQVEADAAAGADAEAGAHGFGEPDLAFGSDGALDCGGRAGFRRHGSLLPDILCGLALPVGECRIYEKS